MGDLNEVTLAVLAGGEGSRLGKPKSLLRIDGVPILDWLIRRWNWQGPTMLITTPGREHPAGFETFGREVTDPEPGLGPLRGLLTGLEHLTTPLLVVTTVDMPLIAATQIEWYVEQVREDTRVIGVMARRNSIDGQQVEPFPSAYRVEALDIVRQHFEGGSRSTYSLQNYAGVKVVSAPTDWPESTWLNLNTPADLSEFARLGMGSADF